MMRATASAISILAYLIAASAFAQEPPATAATEPGADAPNSSLPWLRLEDLAATRNRPLFAPDRRPPYSAPPPPPTDPLAVAQPEPRPEKPMPPALKGIIVEGSSTLVLLEDQASAEQVFVRSGDSFGPWQVIADTDHSVRLAAEGDHLVLDLHEPD